MDENRISLERDFWDVFKEAEDRCMKVIDQSNEIRRGVVRLLITLSTTILLISISFIDKLYPLSQSSALARNILILGWLSFLFAIMSGIGAELEEAQDCHRTSKVWQGILKSYLKKKSENKAIRIEMDLAKDLTVNFPIFWGVAEIWLFIFGVSTICIYMIMNIF